MRPGERCEGAVRRIHITVQMLEPVPGATTCYSSTGEIYSTVNVQLQNSSRVGELSRYLKQLQCHQHRFNPVCHIQTTTVLVSPSENMRSHVRPLSLFQVLARLMTAAATISSSSSAHYTPYDVLPSTLYARQAVATHHINN